MLLALGRRARLAVWAARARTRMRWVGIDFSFSAGQGAVFVRPPFVLAGSEQPTGEPGSLDVVLGRNIRFAPGVIIEAEPGYRSRVEIGDGTRLGANVHLYLRGGSIRIGPGCEIRDGCVLKATGGELELGTQCFLSYGCVLHATERVQLEDRVGLGERVSVIDSRHETDGGDDHWTKQPISTQPIVIGENTLMFINSVATMGAHVGPNSQVASGAILRAGDYPPSVLLAGVPAEVVRTLAEDE